MTTIAACGHYHLLEALLSRLSTSGPVQGGGELCVPLLSELGVMLDEGFGAKHMGHPHNTTLVNFISAVRNARALRIPFAGDQPSLRKIYIPSCSKPHIHTGSRALYATSYRVRCCCGIKEDEAQGLQTIVRIPLHCAISCRQLTEGTGYSRSVRSRRATYEETPVEQAQSYWRICMVEASFM